MSSDVKGLHFELQRRSLSFLLLNTPVSYSDLHTMFSAIFFTGVIDNKGITLTLKHTVRRAGLLAPVAKEIWQCKVTAKWTLCIYQWKIH